jgi:hypothetical protein
MAPDPPVLPYRPPEEGRDYWIRDGLLADPGAVVRRCLERAAWIPGFPHRPETWPGLRSPDALPAADLETLEAWVRAVTGAPRLWQGTAPGLPPLQQNHAQLVAAGESGPRPHTDSRALCRFAAVLYLTPDAPEWAGTTFYRQRLADGRLGGNICPPPHANLREALGVPALPLDAWSQELAIPNRFNRLVLYQADRVHSASAYFGREPRERRLTAVFFWMA